MFLIELKQKQIIAEEGHTYTPLLYPLCRKGKD